MPSASPHEHHRGRRPTSRPYRRSRQRRHARGRDRQSARRGSRPGPGRRSSGVCARRAVVITCHHERCRSATFLTLRRSTAIGLSSGEAVIWFEIVRTASKPLIRASSRYRSTCSTRSSAPAVLTSTRQTHRVFPRSTTIAPSGIESFVSSSMNRTSVNGRILPAGAPTWSRTARPNCGTAPMTASKR